MDFETFGEFLQAVARAASHPGGPRVPGLTYNVQSGLHSNEAPEGGYLVPLEFAADLMERTYATGAILSRCTRVPIRRRAVQIPVVSETNRENGSRFGGLNLQWTSEGDELPASKPAFGARNLSLYKLGGVVFVTNELLNDAAALGTILERLFALEAAHVLEDRILNGSGVAQPLGIANAAAKIVTSKESGQSPDTVVAENFKNMMARLWGPSRSRSIWVTSNAVMAQAEGLTHAGAPLVKYEDGLPIILGRPVIQVEQTAALGDEGDVVLGDFGEYAVADRELETTPSLHCKFLEDEAAFRFVLRTDGMPFWQSAVTPINSAVTQSPFVALESRA